MAIKEIIIAAVVAGVSLGEIPSDKDILENINPEHVIEMRDSTNNNLQIPKADFTFGNNVTNNIEPDPDQTNTEPPNSARFETMSDHNMLPGFSRSKVFAEYDQGIERVGSFVEMQNQHAQMGLLSNTLHPEFFQNGIDFRAIRKYYESKGKKVVMIVPGAFKAPGFKQIEGIAYENGQSVGQQNSKASSKGLLIIKNGQPESDFTHYTDINQLARDAARYGWSFIQSTSTVRDGNYLSSSNSSRYELRFYIETYDGKKGIINLDAKKTQQDHFEILKKLNIKEAVWLDMGAISEGRLYDKNNYNDCITEGYVMVDEQFGTKNAGATNAIVLLSD